MLTQTASYALRALIYLANQAEDDFHQTRKIARAVHVPSNYLGKILQKLARFRIVDSQKGLHGGFRIALLPEQISFYDVLHAIEPINRSCDCPMVVEDAPKQMCNIQRRFGSIDRVYIKFLNETTLADVLADEPPLAPCQSIAHIPVELRHRLPCVKPSDNARPAAVFH